eukprot:8213202-Prorocentrum_lima.AAC.1
MAWLKAAAFGDKAVGVYSDFKSALIAWQDLDRASRSTKLDAGAARQVEQSAMQKRGVPMFW